MDSCIYYFNYSVSWLVDRQCSSSNIVHQAPIPMNIYCKCQNFITHTGKVGRLSSSAFACLMGLHIWNGFCCFQYQKSPGWTFRRFISIMKCWDSSCLYHFLILSNDGFSYYYYYYLHFWHNFSFKPISNQSVPLILNIYFIQLLNFLCFNSILACYLNNWMSDLYSQTIQDCLDSSLQQLHRPSVVKNSI